MSIIPETIQHYLPSKRKHTPSGWISFNAVCCQDNRQRGGLIINQGNIVTYHCFNCGFKTSWQPGRQLSHGMKKFMRYLNIPDDIINKLSVEALRLLSEEQISTSNSLVPSFITGNLPLNSKPIISYLDNIPDKLIPILEYINARGLFLEDYNFYWTPNTGFNNRLIIPFYYQNNIVGYTARSITQDKNRYISEQQPGYVFNLDAQHDNRQFVIVCEGPIDAISINGCALMGSTIKEQQNLLLQQLHKQIILVPDKDTAGQKLIKQALDNNWAVSMPDYPDNVKDINDCILKIGRLATLFLIINSIQTNNLKIQLKEKKWFK